MSARHTNLHRVLVTITTTRLTLFFLTYSATPSTVRVCKVVGGTVSSTGVLDSFPILFEPKRLVLRREYRFCLWRPILGGWEGSGKRHAKDMKRSHSVGSAHGTVKCLQTSRRRHKPISGVANDKVESLKRSRVYQVDPFLVASHLLIGRHNRARAVPVDIVSPRLQVSDMGF